MLIQRFNPEEISSLAISKLERAAQSEKKHLQDLANETKNMEFHSVPIKFYPDDVEKMRGMSLAEENAYKLQLKFNKRYIIPNYSNYYAG